MSAIEPSAEQAEAFFSDERSTPIVMVNLNKYRERAAYPDDYAGEENTAVGGSEAYMRYGMVAFEEIGAVGGRILYGAEPENFVIGHDETEWDEIILVYYPSRQAFQTMVTKESYLRAVVHREAAIERCQLIACPAAGYGELADQLTK